MSGERSSRPLAAGPAPELAPVPEEAVIDTVPDEVREAARRAFSSRDRRADVLHLVFDSLVDREPAPGPRRLEFGSGEQAAQLRLTVTDAPHGQVVIEIESRTPQLQLHEVRTGAEVVELSEAGPGRWAAGPLAHGLLTVLCEVDDRRLQTAALRV